MDNNNINNNIINDEYEYNIQSKDDNYLGNNLEGNIQDKDYKNKNQIMMEANTNELTILKNAGNKSNDKDKNLNIINKNKNEIIKNIDISIDNNKEKNINKTEGVQENYSLKKELDNYDLIIAQAKELNNAFKDEKEK